MTENHNASLYYHIGFSVHQKRVEFPYKSEVGIQSLSLDSCKIIESLGHRIS